MRNSSGNSVESNFYSYTPEGKVTYDLSTEKILVKFKDGIGFEKQQQLLKAFPQIAPLTKDMLLPSPKLSLLSLSGKGVTEAGINTLLTQLNDLTDIEYANPFLVYKDGTLQGITNRLIVKLRSQNDLALLREQSRKYNFNILENYKYDSKLYFIEVNPSANENALSVANKLFELNLFATCEPDFLRLIQKMTTNDTYLNYQWSLNNTGSTLQYSGISGADMNVFNAWGITTGSTAIKVAIVDEGVDLVHPDLINNLLPGYDGTLQGSNGAPQGNDAHGTACAGIVAAQGNNNLGVAGVAYGCKIVPVRIAYGSGSSWVTNDSWIGSSIDWAWDIGDADVLSNSWGGGSPSTLINDPINRATTLGRGGLGSAVLFAAGNNSASSAGYPSSQSNVISVIAMSMCHQRKSQLSCDGENFWGSNYGTGADVAAPGVKIYTTDISGSAGYRTGDYMETFNGTSSACPNAAGVMALLLSANPTLTYTQARQILENSCNKVGTYGYNAAVPDQPNGTWSTELGYGMVNAYAALQLANPVPCSGAPLGIISVASNNNFCIPTNVTITLASLPTSTGITYQWETSSDNISYGEVSGATNFSYSYFANSSNWYRCKMKCGSDSSYSSSIYVFYNNVAISSFPHSEHFATNQIPCGWSVQNDNADANTFLVNGTSYRTYSYSAIYQKNTTNAANDWLFTPALNLVSGTDYVVRFWYKGRSVTLPEKLEVRWGNAASSSAMTLGTIWSNTNITNTTYSLGVTSQFSPATSGNYYVGFRVFSDANKYDLNIDDITIDIATPCSMPLLGGIITGPSTISAGNGTISQYTVSGNTGLDMQWQYSSNSGVTWVDYGVQVSSIANIYFPTVGNYLLRVKSMGSNCPDAYSPDFPVTVIPRLGDLFSNPILLYDYVPESMNTGPLSGFFSNYTGPNAQPSNDVYFKLTTSACADSIFVATCGSGFDTYLHLLDASGNHLYSLDDSPLCGQQAIFKYPVTPNTTYYIVAEGWNTSSGYLEIGYLEMDSIKFIPSISIGTPSTICSGSNVDITASGGVSYVWSNGATTATTSVNIAGTYTVTATDSYGCTGTNTVTIANSTSSTVWFADADGDGFGNNLITQSSCNQPVGYVSDNTDCDDNNTLVHASQSFFIDNDLDGYGSTTTAMLCTTIPPAGYSMNNLDCDDNNNAINPAASEICGNSIDENCNGLINEGCCNIVLTSVVTNAHCSNIPIGGIDLSIANATAPLVYSWSNGAITQDINSLAAGSYTVNVVDAMSCTQSAVIAVGSNNLVPNAPTAINGPGGACRNQTGVVFSVTPISTASSYQWTLPSGATGSSTTNSITVNFGSGYNTGNICVRAINACGQSAQFCRSVTRYTAAPGTPGTISGLNAGVCPSTAYTYSVTAVSNATGYTWTAPTNATISSGQGTNSVTVTYNASFGTSGTLSVRASNCIGNSANRTLSISRTPSQPSTISSPNSVCANALTAPFSVTNVVPYSYIWTVPAGCTIASGTGTNSITINWGTNAGTVSVRSNVGCSTSSLRSKNITTTTCSTSRFAADLDEHGPALTVYPNPSFGETHLILNCEEEINYQLIITASNGQRVYTAKGITAIGKNTIHFDTQQYTPGLYFIRFITEDGRIEVAKMIVQ